MWLDRLRDMKIRSGQTTKEIADKSGIPEPTLEKIFSGATKEPKLPTIRQLVHYLGHTLDDLEDEDTKKPTTVSDDGLDDATIALAKKLRQMDIDDLELINAQADVILSRRKKK